MIPTIFGARGDEASRDREFRMRGGPTHAATGALVATACTGSTAAGFAANISTGGGVKLVVVTTDPTSERTSGATGAGGGDAMARAAGASGRAAGAASASECWRVANSRSEGLVGVDWARGWGSLTVADIRRIVLLPELTVVGRIATTGNAENDIEAGDDRRRHARHIRCSMDGCFRCAPIFCASGIFVANGERADAHGELWPNSTPDCTVFKIQACFLSACDVLRRRSQDIRLLQTRKG